MNKNNKWLSVILAFALCLPLFAFTSGDGTYENPYEIAGQSDIVNLIDMVATNDCSGLYFLQTADIDLSVFGNFQGIGSYDTPFSGDYDGDGYWISNMYCEVIVPSTASANSYHFRGFFNYASNATLQNISVQGYITSAYLRIDSGGGSAVLNVGGVAGRMNGGVAEGLTSDVKQDCYIANGNNSSLGSGVFNQAVGGVFGRWNISSGGTFKGLVNYGDISVSYQNIVIASGVVGLLNSTSGSDVKLYDFENYGNITANLRTPQTLSWATVCGETFGLSLSRVYHYYCQNYGTITLNGYGRLAGLVRPYFANLYLATYYCANYGDVVLNLPETSSYPTSTTFVEGVCGGGCATLYNVGNTNYGNLRIKARNTSEIGVAGVSAPRHTSGVISKAYNKGNIYIDTEGSANMLISVGGICADGNPSESSFYKLAPSSCLNEGNIYINNANPNCSFLIGGIAGGARQDSTMGISINPKGCFSIGDIVFNSVDNAVANSYLGGIAGLRDWKYEALVVSNCYAYGTIKWSGKKVYVGGISGIADADINDSENFNINHSYSACSFIGETNGNYVGTLVGHADDTLGSVSISDCFAITTRSDLKTIGFIGVNVLTNNLKTFTYEEAYHNPSITQGFLYNYAFTQANTTNEWADLTLPINKLIFPTITEAIRKKHTYTSVMGYKRYVKTNRK